ncbi:MAG: S-layer protein, partial [Candidatus Methanofastidiosia archaeon]
MTLRKIGTLVIGSLLPLAMVASAAAQEVPPTDFFVDPETGQPNCVIVVGSGAAAMDVVSATMLAAKIGTMTFTETEDEVTFTDTSVAVHEDVNPIIFVVKSGTWINQPVNAVLWGLGYPTVDVPDAVPYHGWDNNATPICYTLNPLWYFDDYDNGYWGNGDQHFQPWETHEEIQTRFDDFYTEREDMLLEHADCGACLFGGDIKLYNPDDGSIGDLWSWYPIPGLIYKADNIFVPPSIICYMDYNHPAGTRITGLDYNRVRAFPVPEPWMVYYGMLPQFKLFNTIYTVIDGGPILDMNGRTGTLGNLFGKPYLVVGDPSFEPQIYLYKHEP